jgi:hypothetical protein
MFSELSLSPERLDGFNRIALKVLCVLICPKVISIRQTIVTQLSRFPRVNAHGIGHRIQPFIYHVPCSAVADGYHRRLPEVLVDRSSAEVVLHTPVH